MQISWFMDQLCDKGTHAKGDCVQMNWVLRMIELDSIPEYQLDILCKSLSRAILFLLDPML